ncbi:phosphotransferase family protein [Streptomyces sp. 4F14]|uniref:phosphotransferase family protein n=1 Tax=Streptomyces sp. 4F14 TaxID=3394380 RepID=UPI003A84B2AF
MTAPASLPTMREVLRARGMPCHRLARALPTGNRLLHGDFNPANLLRRPATGVWLTVDWSGAARGCPAADAALTLVTIARGAAPTATPRWARAAAPRLPRRLPGPPRARPGRGAALGGGVAGGAVRVRRAHGAAVGGEEAHVLRAGCRAGSSWVR